MERDWAGRVSPFMLLGLMAGILIGITIFSQDDTFIDLWFLTFIYGVIGYALDMALKPERYPKLRFIFLLLSVIIYVASFIVIRFILMAQFSFPVID